MSERERFPEWDELPEEVQGAIKVLVFFAFLGGLMVGAILVALLPWSA